MLIYPYRDGSRSVRRLAQALPSKIIRLEGSQFRGRPTKVVLNWGNTHTNTEVDKCKVINPSHLLRTATNKLTFFNTLKEKGFASIPAFTTNQEDTNAWFEKESIVLCRTVLDGHSGRGIVIARNSNELVGAPLYVRYVRKSEEYRVHVFRGMVIDTQRKARRTEVPDDKVNWLVRNLEGGFIYAREGVDQLKNIADLGNLAIQVVTHLGLDFGAVDIIQSKKTDKLYVLEVNTAPGLEGTTLEKYVAAIKQHYPVTTLKPRRVR